MGLGAKIDHPEDCSCCWIMGYGVNEDEPSVWTEKIFSVDEECQHHGQKYGAGSGSAGS